MSSDPLKIVLTPEALGEALLDSGSQAILTAWRDGRVQPVVSRSLLIRYFRLLRRLALPERLLRWWGYWLATAPKVQIVNDPPEAASLQQLCSALATQTPAPYIVVSQPGKDEALPTTLDPAAPRQVSVRTLLELA